MSVGSAVSTVTVLSETVNSLNSDAEAELSPLDNGSLPRLHRLGGTDPSMDSSSLNS